MIEIAFTIPLTVSVFGERCSEEKGKVISNVQSIIKTETID